MSLRIGLITTLNTNIGDDLIREGICRVLREIFKGRKIEFIPINKHQPFSVYPEWHPIRLARFSNYLPRAKTFSRRLIERWAAELRFSRFDSCDLIVQCGAPVLWPGCHRCEWAAPLWHQVVGRLSNHLPVLNLAAGSCYPWERQPSRIPDPKDEEYLRAILGYCRVTTVRDILARRLCSSLGTKAPMIPCSALIAPGKNTVKVQSGEVILINYMNGGGHYDWAQGIDAAGWRQVVKSLIRRLQKRHRLAFLCHDEQEYRLVIELDPSLPRLWPRTPEEYSAAVREAKAALCNRLHASVALAGLGIPSLSVGTDTRLLMVEAIGLPYLYVKKATADLLEAMIEDTLSCRQQERERLLALKSETFSRYTSVIAGVL